MSTLKKLWIYEDWQMKWSLFFILYIVLITSTIAGGRPIPSGNVGDNIALGKSYNFSSAPNYASCTDTPGDTTQLTDDYNYAGPSSLWTQLSTVGWSGTNPTITIDLGTVQPIKGMSFYTSARANAGVYWPSAINLKVSNDNVNYYSVGDLVSLSDQVNGAPPTPDDINRFHCYYTNGLSTHGRFVQLEVVRQGSFAFVDEIKVIRGSNSLLPPNIALNKTYTMNPAPNYSYCTDEDDDQQLTDGSYYTGASTPWAQPEYLVGWSWKGCVEIKIDLGSNQAIEGVSYNTFYASELIGALGPVALSVLVSDDDSTYYHAGEIVSLSSEHGCPKIFLPYPYWQEHSIWTDRLVTHGRYVKLIGFAGSGYLFSDEIEIYRGRTEMLNQSRGSAVSDLDSLLKKDRIRAGTAMRILQDAQDVQLQTDDTPGLTNTEINEIESLLVEAVNEAMNLPDSDPDIFRTIMPLNSSHVKIFSALAKLWQDQGYSGLLGWLTPVWAPLSLTQSLSGIVPASTGISITAMQGEYRSTSFNLSNASDEDMTVSLNITGLPGGTNPSYISVKEVAWTDTLAGIPIAVALPEAETDANGYIINIPAGMTRQVFLTFNPTDTNPGQYGIFSGSITAGSVTVPVEFTISSLNFPQRPTLGLGGFDYTDQDISGGVTSVNRNAFIAMLNEYFVDSPWALASVMPHTPSFTNFDTWYYRWPDARNYHIFLNVGSSFGAYEQGTPEFNTAVANWINAYAAHWTALGLNLNQIQLLLIDEPQNSSQADTIIYWANAIKAAQPNIKIWEDGTKLCPTSIFSVCDVLCPDAKTWYSPPDGTWQDNFRNSGKTLNFYSCSIFGKRHDPYRYDRLLAWLCWKENANAMHFWSMMHTGGSSSWNEYNADLYSNAPLFLDPNDAVVTAGKHLEAIREGVEDYEYLNMLKNRINALTGSNHPKLTAAQTLLNGAADAVLDNFDSFLWFVNSEDREVADQKRIQILNMLEELNDIAMGKSYTLSPSPNYAPCTDTPGDTTQLTDDYSYAGPSSLWTQLSTVGWSNTNPTITIDLGAVKSIKGVSFYTSSRANAGVYWPSAINLKVSNDNVNYYSVGDLVSLSNQENGAPPTPDDTNQFHCYRTNSLSAEGRFVRLEVVRQGSFAFVDEVKVFEN